MEARPGPWPHSDAGISHEVPVPDPQCVFCATKRKGDECISYCNQLCGEPTFPICACISNPEEECPKVLEEQNVTYYDEENPDYDTRGWTSELGTTAVTLHNYGSINIKWKVLNFLLDLQNGDTSFPDKWDYFPHPYNVNWYVWSDPDDSVMRTSVNFFELSELLQKSNVDKDTTVTPTDPLKILKIIFEN